MTHTKTKDNIMKVVEKRIERIKRLKYGTAFNEEYVIENFQLDGSIFETDQVQSIEEVSIEVTFEFINIGNTLTIEVIIEAIRVVWMDWEGNTDMYMISNDGKNFDTFKQFPINDTVVFDDLYHFVIDTDCETLTIIENV